MRFHGLADLGSQEAIELFAAEGEAVRVLAEIIGDEPEWEGRLFVRAIDLFKRSLN